MDTKMVPFLGPALLHGTPAAGVSQTLRRGTRNGITKRSQKAPPIFGRAVTTLSIGAHSSLVLCRANTKCICKGKYEVYLFKLRCFNCAFIE